MIPLPLIADLYKVQFTTNQVTELACSLILSWCNAVPALYLFTAIMYCFLVFFLDHWFHWSFWQAEAHKYLLILFILWRNAILQYLHSIRCFPSLRNEKRRCCYNIITTISHVISSEGIHGTEKYVWSGLLLLLKIPEIHLDSHFEVSEWT